MIYLDYAATTPIDDEVVETIQDALVHNFGNPSSIYRIGKKSKRQIQNARTSIAESIGVPDKSLFFTSGATEANNWALRSQAYQARKLGLGNHIVATAIEHPSVKEELAFLEQNGFQVSYLKPDSNGAYTAEAFRNASQAGTIGWVAMAVNNEVGSILPVFEIGQAAQVAGYWFHVDAVQAFQTVDWDMGSIPATSLVASGHKIYAPKGIGLLIYRPWREEMILNPLLHGGGQEAKQRSGTENTPYILGLAKAFELLKQERAERLAHYAHLAQHFKALLETSGLAIAMNGDPHNRVNNIHSIWLQGQEASRLLIQLDLRDIYISAGSACSAGSVSDSPILQAYYPEEPDRWHESLRVSFGKQTSEEDITQFVNALIQIQKGR